MDTKLAALILAGTTIASSYLTLIIGSIYPKLFAAVFGIQKADEAERLMPSISRMVARDAIFFALGAVLILAVGALLLRRFPERAGPILAISLSAQGMLFWTESIAWCFEEFEGSMTLHTPAHFELALFFRFAGGVFPVTFCAIFAPAFAAWFSLRARCD